MPQSIFETKAVAEAYAPSMAPEFFMLSGCLSAGDGGGALYKNVGSEPSHAGKFLITLSGGGTAWYEIVERTLIPQMLGIVPDTGADLTSGITSLFDVANAIGASVYFGPGAWRQNGPIAKTYGLEIELDAKAVIDFRNAPNNTTCWSFSGSYGTTYNCGAVSAGTRNLTLTPASAAGDFAFGDYIIISSDDVWDAARTNTKRGEIVRVQSINATTGNITLVTDLQDTYTTSVKLEKSTFLQGVRVRGGRFIGADGVSGLYNVKRAINITLGRGCSVEGVRLERFDDFAVSFIDSFGCQARNNQIRVNRSVGTGYAVVFGNASQDCVASNNYFEDCRHALTTATKYFSRPGVTRRITYANNHVLCSSAASSGAGGDALDTHAAAEDITMIGNTVVGATGCAINVEARTCVVVGNTAIDCGYDAILVHNEGDANGRAVVCGNAVRNPGQGGIRITSGSGTGTYDGVVVGDNIVEGCSNASIQVNSSGQPNFKRVAVTGNVVGKPDAAATTAILIYSVDHLILANNAAEGVSGAATCQLIDCRDFMVSGNSMTQPAGSLSHVLSVQGGSTKGAITGNSFTSDDFSAPITGEGVILAGTVTYTLVRINNVRGSGGITLGSGAGNSTSADNII